MLNTEFSSVTIVPFISLIISIVSLIFSTINMVKTHKDKKIGSVVENIANLLALYEKEFSKEETQRLRMGKHINGEHRKYETNINNLLGNSHKDIRLKEKVSDLRTEKPQDAGSLVNLKNELERELRNWRGL